MVCLPCIVLPLFMAIYLKFIQPYIFRYLPERWVRFLDPILYPTCPVKIPPPTNTKETAESADASTESCCAGGSDESKKDQ